MDADVIERMKAEEIDLIKKLTAVRSVLSAYGVAAPRVTAIAPDQDREPERLRVRPPAPQRTTSPRPRVSIDRFSDYGASVVRAAIEAVRNETDRPVMTRRLVELIEAHGVEVRGLDKVNALSALLARSVDLKSIGRRGWTLADDNDHQVGHEPEENEPSATLSSDGSDADDLDDAAREFV